MLPVPTSVRAVGQVPPVVVTIVRVTAPVPVRVMTKSQPDFEWPVTE